ncbi:hypothetical protein O1611_g9079 [Lasiodiplodia mahajangana]|uniref:Uncharacterized protein n=1 Tax=Lasiodiplodia mahajangana TaxID=1108764 RepID=A0ACC2JAY2_9PEZI|nr:hypothetical protein O1611_g9079 [Lasiodiplodia mahajangana]
MENPVTHSAKRRTQYSYLKCTYCRKGKQKCEPPDRQWPLEKCNRCQQKGLSCSPSLKTDGTPGNESIDGGMQGFEPRPLLVQVQDCALAMNWLRLLWRIAREAGNEVGWQRTARAVALPTPLSQLIRGVELVETLVSSMVSSALKQAVLCRDKCHETLLIRLALQGTEVQRMQEGSPWMNIAHAYSEDPGSETPFTGLESILSASADVLAKSGEWVAAMDTKTELLHRMLNRLKNEAGRLGLQRLKQLYDNAERAEGHIPLTTVRERAGLEKEAKRAGITHPLPDELTKPILHDPRFLEGPDSALLDAIAGVDITYLNSADSLGRTFLHLACDPVSPRAVEKMLRYGVQVNARDLCGRTALHVACKAAVRSSSRFAADQQEVISLLLEHAEIDIYLKDRDGLFAVEPAIRNRRLEIAACFQNCASFRADTELGQMLAEAQQPIPVGRYDLAWDKPSQERYKG